GQWERGGWGIRVRKLSASYPRAEAIKAREILRMKFPYALTSCMVISPGQNLVNPDNPISQDTQALAPNNAEYICDNKKYVNRRPARTIKNASKEMEDTIKPLLGDRTCRED
ncbi:hypothetical protein V1477_015448, partial [Vespula maculifrons]